MVKMTSWETCFEAYKISKIQELLRSKIYSVEAGWTLRSLLYCPFHFVDKGKVAENFAKESVVFYLQYLFFPLKDNSDFTMNSIYPSATFYIIR
jgi:hypothetical protein